MTRFDILTLHPGLCSGPLDHSILGRARKAGLVEVNVVDLREWAPGRHRQADDIPYGGGQGMVLKVDVIHRAVQALRTAQTRVILLEASGRRFDQACAARLAACPHLVLVCGHYEGVDERVREHVVDETLSIGPFVLTGGELPALVVVDSVARLLPGVLGNEASAADDSFSNGTLEYPQYTRPRVWEGWEVPEVLLSGHHARIQAWRREKALERTRAMQVPEVGPEGETTEPELSGPPRS